MNKEERNKIQINWNATLIIIAMHIAAIYGAIVYFSFSNLFICLVVSYFFCLFAMTIGMHRYFSHKSFKSQRWFEIFLIVSATLCMQGSPLYWAALHRAHHQKSEKYGDPHNAALGFWWAHIFWMMIKHPNGFDEITNFKKCRDLIKDPLIMLFEKYYLIFNVVVLIVGYLTAIFFSRLDLFYWVFPVRIVIVWHITWSVNSILHNVWPFLTNINHGPINLKPFSWIMPGEGLHKNHHEHPFSVTNEVEKTDFDLGYRVLRVLKKFHIVDF